MKLMVNLSLEQEAVVADRLTDDQIAQIRTISEEIEVVIATSIEQRNRELVDADALFGEFNPADVRARKEAALGPVHRFRR